MIRKNIKMMNVSKENWIEEFRNVRGTVAQPPTKKEENKKPTSNKKSPYDIFLQKVDNLEKYIDYFNASDLYFYFIYISNRNGYKYVSFNTGRDFKTFSRLSQQFSNKEICCMIEFLYESEQNYLNKSKLTPNLLVSGWINTIYADMQSWVKGEFKKDCNVKKQGKIKKEYICEWDSTNDSEGSCIGGKL